MPLPAAVRIETEIASRGGRRSDYFDDWIVAIDPTLEWDREVDPPSLVPLGPIANADPQLAGPNCNNYAGCSATVDPACEAPGWNVKCVEDYPTETMNLTASYSNWENVDTPDQLNPIPVKQGLAEFRILAAPQGVASG